VHPTHWLISTQVRVELRYHPSYSGPHATARRHVKDEFAAVIIHRTRKHVIPLGASVEKWSGHCAAGGGAAFAAQRKALVEDLKALGVEKPLEAHVKDVSMHGALASDAILKLVESCADDQAKKVAAVAAVERVFQAQHKSLYEILFDGDGERRELAEVLEKCRDVLQQVAQAFSERGDGREAQRRSHVAALIDAARADAEALANLSSDDVLKLLVKKAKELRPDAKASWNYIAEALNELGIQWDQGYVLQHYASLQSNQTPLTEDEKRRIVVLEEKFRSMWGKWPKIAQQLGNGRTAADGNKVKCYWHDTGQDRPWSCCDTCEQWRLREKGTVVVEGAHWTCADGGRKCTEPCDSVLPEIVEEAPDAATSIEVAVPDAVEPSQPALPPQPPHEVEELVAQPPRATSVRYNVVSKPWAADGTNELVWDAEVATTVEEQPPPDVVEVTAQPARAPKVDTSMPYKVVSTPWAADETNELAWDAEVVVTTVKEQAALEAP